MESRGQAEDRRELAAARSEIQRLRKQLQAARAQLQAAQGRIAWLESRLETLLRTLFGRKSEKPDEPPGKEDGTDGDGKPADEEQDGKQEEERPRKPRKQRGRKPGTPTPKRVDRLVECHIVSARVRRIISAPAGHSASEGSAHRKALLRKETGELGGRWDGGDGGPWSLGEFLFHAPRPSVIRFR